MSAAAKILLGISLGLAICSSVVAETPRHDGSYYCVAEFSGGVAYDERLKKWDSARFRPTDKFIVQFKYIGPHMCGGVDCLTDEYFVTVARGDKKEVCKSRWQDEPDKVQFTRGVGRGDCEADLRRYIFGLKYNRYLATFEFGGYAIGMDQVTDTPYISGGTCTKIP